MSDVVSRRRAVPCLARGAFSISPAVSAFTTAAAHARPKAPVTNTAVPSMSVFSSHEWLLVRTGVGTGVGTRRIVAGASAPPSRVVDAWRDLCGLEVEGHEGDD